jgi:hypothetical protein
LAGLQGVDAVAGQSGGIDIAGAVVEIVGDEDSAAVLGIAVGVRGFSLSAFDRVEEGDHSQWVIG